MCKLNYSTRRFLLCIIFNWNLICIIGLSSLTYLKNFHKTCNIQDIMIILMYSLLFIYKVKSDLFNARCNLNYGCHNVIANSICKNKVYVIKSNLLYLCIEKYVSLNMDIKCFFFFTSGKTIYGCDSKFKRR